jgi:hypothetical protein
MSPTGPNWKNEGRDMLQHHDARESRIERVATRGCDASIIIIMAAAPVIQTKLDKRKGGTGCNTRDSDTRAPEKKGVIWRK